MNYCFTVCRAAEEKVQQKSSALIDMATPSPSSSPAGSSGAGAYFFGKFFSFGSTTSPFANSFTVKASNPDDINDNLF